MHAILDHVIFEHINEDILSLQILVYHLPFPYALHECRDGNFRPHAVLFHDGNFHSVVDQGGRSVCTCSAYTSDHVSSLLEASFVVSSGAAISVVVAVPVCMVGEGSP